MGLRIAQSIRDVEIRPGDARTRPSQSEFDFLRAGAYLTAVDCMGKCFFCKKGFDVDATTAQQKGRWSALPGAHWLERAADKLYRWHYDRMSLIG